jgi:hypothetical protein
MRKPDKRNGDVSQFRAGGQLVHLQAGGGDVGSSSDFMAA